jgi:hypothetical protein
MTSADVIRFARECGLIHKDDDEQFINQLERFASIAEAEGAIAERRKNQTDIERWKGEAATAEKWRGLAISKDGDARRLMACWNACTGITTEQLQSDHDQGYEPWGHVQHLTTGRDALLDAMQEISRMSVGTTVGRTADAAIAKATGVKS